MKKKIYEDSDKTAITQYSDLEDVSAPSEQERVASRRLSAQKKIPSMDDIINSYRESKEVELPYSTESIPYEEDYTDEAKLTNLAGSTALANKMRWKYARPSNINQWEINRNRRNKSLADTAGKLTDTEALALRRSLLTKKNAGPLLKANDVNMLDKESLSNYADEADEISDSVMQNRKMRRDRVLGSKLPIIDSLPENVIGQAIESMHGKSLKNAAKLGKLTGKIALPVQAAITTKAIYDELQSDAPNKLGRALRKGSESIVPIDEAEIEKIREMENERLRKDELFIQDMINRKSKK